MELSYDKQLAVDQLSAIISSGELVSLFGPSGCGKSTTLLVLAGLFEPSAGDILFFSCTFLQQIG
ncbi:ATP-binding cassette domain-containing protein [Acinetobacter sp. CUI P1]|nr:ATP-binding cassette domain-containing protein [Acinetobacter sp. CUI P1]